MKMANGFENNLRGSGESPDYRGDLTHGLTFFTVNDAPFSLITGRPALKTMPALSDFDKDVAIFRCAEQVATVPWWMEKEKNGRSFSEEFTSDKKNDIDENSVEQSEKNPKTEEKKMKHRGNT